MYIIGMITLTFFAVIGAASFITSLLRANGADEHLSIVLSELNEDNAEARVRKAAHLCSEIRCEKLICECADMKTEEICARLSDEYSFIKIRGE